MTNCPNCGAPITGDVCEYCGTVFKKAVNYEVVPTYGVTMQEFADAFRVFTTTNERRAAAGLEPIGSEKTQ